MFKNKTRKTAYIYLKILTDSLFTFSSIVKRNEFRFKLIIHIWIMICELFSRVLYYLSQINLEITNDRKSPINNVIISLGHYSLIRCTHTYIYIYLTFNMYSIEIRPLALTRQIQKRVSYTYMCVIHDVL